VFNVDEIDLRTSYNGGTCWMKTGGASKSDAFYVAQEDYVCGVNPPNTNKVSISSTFYV